MKLKEIKRNGFYTDGEFVYKKEKNGEFIMYDDSRRESEFFLAAGVRECGIFPKMLEKDVRIVNLGEEFFNGNIKVIDQKTLKIKAIKVINRKIDEKGYTTNHDGYEEYWKIIKF